jgi:integrase
VRLQLLRDGTLDLRKTDRGDGHYKPTIDLHPHSRELLLDLAMEIGPDELVFRNRDRRGLAHSDVERAFRKARTLAALSDDPRPLRFHDLRHTAITRMANAPNVALPYV